ncbi:serine peptidase [Streptomyces virginiae]|uniref:serine peptidase n=1 Tax=Streptomyces virginiae TaxID=1961 RepID=UPI00225600F4|nr:serine peptidase [Streptomyces virginiae]MCX4715084.1 serine peptidase [Streptomyces virginiae]MCX5272823.1 serine peptidase [Streptomyces virginiae]
MKIVGIHGIGNYRPGELPETAARNLSAAWSKHLGAEAEVVYFADLLREQGGQSDDASDLEDLTETEEEIVHELLAAQPAATDPGRVSQGLLTAVLRDGIAELAESWACPEWLMEWFMVRFVKEVAAYQRSGPARDAVQQRLREALDRHQPDVLIAHSLGSVVAYETLHHDGTPPLPLWVTVGSPLALPKAIFNQLNPSPEAGRGARPPQVARWTNLADPGDPVAIPAKGVSRRFVGVDSDEHHVVHRGFKFHHAESYLKSAGLANVLATAS